MIICKAVNGVGPVIGEAQAADPRVCMAKQGVGPVIGESGVIVIFGSSGAIVFGSSGKIRF